MKRKKQRKQAARKTVAKAKAARKPAAKTAGTRKPAARTAGGSGPASPGVYTPAPLQSDGWPPFRYPRP